MRKIETPSEIETLEIYFILKQKISLASDKFGF